ncbi:MAG: UvrD-helicase domain-containing protein [Firmicutes bacterium]|nr:UvrD-helicase domain-containing protein [Bacillota bacterium]
MIILVPIIVAGIFLYKRHLYRKEEKRKASIENDPTYRALVGDMKAKVTFITSNPEYYLDASKRKQIKSHITGLVTLVEEYDIRGDYYGYPEYYTLKVAQVDIATKLNEFNQVFVQQELEKYKDFFDKIDGHGLNEQQRKAVVIDELCNLVVAGAGSGKTKTVFGKVSYLLEKGVLPSEILLISFTKNSAKDLVDKIQNSEIKASTFHSLGLNIIQTHNKGMRIDIDDNIETYIEDYFTKEIVNHPNDLQAFLEFVGCYFSIPQEIKDGGCLGDKIESERYIDFETLNGKYQNITAGEKKTIKGERVKSLEELIIANFLFMNGVHYEYEKQYPHDTSTDNFRRVYKPDFFLPDYDIYLEHFGINKQNRCPWLSKIEEQKYLEGMAWKREIHVANDTRLVETYSYYQADGKLLVNLENILLGNGVTLEPVSFDIMKSLVDEIQAESTNKEFIKLCCTFTSLFKANGFAERHFHFLREKFLQKDNRVNNPFVSTRTLQFINLVEKVYLYYQSRLAENNAIDFTDMINNATKIVHEYGSHPYKYIIIDEYQDIGMDRFKLINAIIEKTSAHLMCVGDDWQSIFRFAGSDSNLFTKFQEYWGETSISKIEQTYRYSQELINIAGAFIMKNPNQIPKIMRSGQPKCMNPVSLHFYKGKYKEQHFTTVLGKLLEHIDNLGDANKKIKLLLLGRTNYDDPQIAYGKYKNLEIKFLSVHKSKGLEADYVIILNMRNDRLGFPNKISDDPILQLLLPAEDNYPYSEERRLFYVALTRTKNQVFLLVPERDASAFAHEIKPFCHLEIPKGENLMVNNPTCPKCKSGRLVIRQGNESGNFFVGCLNFPTCDFTNKDTSIIENPIKCLSCGGFLVVRNGQQGKFLGCTSYPNCRHTDTLLDDN